MSVVVAIKDKEKIYIGADSQVTRGGTRTTLKNPNNYKVWKVRGAEHCLMAHVGNMRDSNIIRLLDDLVNEYDMYKGYIGYEFVVKKVVPDIFSALKRCGYLKDEHYIDMMDSSFIFAYQDQVYIINVDGCVLDVSDYAAIGSGSDQAIGSLLSTEGEGPENRIIKAIKATAASDIYVDYPIILVDTETTEFKVINESDEKKYLKIRETKEKHNGKESIQ